MKVNKQWLADHGLTQADIDEFRHPGPDIMGGVTTQPVEDVVPNPHRPDPFAGLNTDINTDIAAFIKKLKEVNPQFFNVDPAELSPEQVQQFQNRLGGFGSQLGGLGGQLGGFGTQLVL